LAKTVESRNHERRCSSLEKSAPGFRPNTYLRIAGMQRNRLEIQTAVQVYGRDDIPDRVSPVSQCKVLARILTAEWA
jgi:hypothetical protein